MVKYFCDRCGAESKLNHSLNPVSILCHLAEIDKRGSVNGYTDSDGNTISGRSVTFELCNRCYNTVMKPVADAILSGEICNVSEETLDWNRKCLKKGK